MGDGYNEDPTKRTDSSDSVSTEQNAGNKQNAAEEDYQQTVSSYRNAESGSAAAGNTDTGYSGSRTGASFDITETVDSGSSTGSSTGSSFGYSSTGSSSSYSTGSSTGYSSTGSSSSYSTGSSSGYGGSGSYSGSSSTGSSSGYGGTNYSSNTGYRQSAGNYGNTQAGGGAGPNGPDGGRHKKNNKKKKGSFGSGLIKADCFGLVFGLCAFGVMYGLSRATGLTAASSSSSSSDSGVVSTVQTTSSSDSSDSSTFGGYDVSDVVAQVMPSIVAVNTTLEETTTDFLGRQYTQEGSGAGSGIIISDDGSTLYILTNYHVIEDSTSVSVQFSDDSTADATVLGYDEDADVAVLKIDESTLEDSTLSTIKVASIGDSDKLEAGQEAIAIGNALGYGQSVTTGVISAVNREVQLTDKTMTLIQTSAAINPGNSGGALLNANGEVIGMNTVKYSDTSVEGMGYAIPINSAIEIAQGLIDGTITTETANQKPYLGIYGGTLGDEMAQQYNAPAGVYVSSVIEGSAADTAGLEAGCIITGFNGEDISTMEELQSAISECEPGDKVTLTAQFPDSNGNYSEQELTVILGAQSEESDSSSSGSSSDSGSNFYGGDSGSSGSGSSIMP